jgi:hypothetical protein
MIVILWLFWLLLRYFEILRQAEKSSKSVLKLALCVKSCLYSRGRRELTRFSKTALHPLDNISEILRSQMTAFGPWKVGRPQKSNNYKAHSSRSISPRPGNLGWWNWTIKNGKVAQVSECLPLVPPPKNKTKQKKNGEGSERVPSHFVWTHAL